MLEKTNLAEQEFSHLVDDELERLRRELEKLKKQIEYLQSDLRYLELQNTKNL